LIGHPPQKTSSIRVALRSASRALVLVLSLILSFLRYAALWIRFARQGKRISSLDRAVWLQRCCKMVLSAMGIRFQIEGSIPQSTTLIVANHLSYLDILIASAAVPCTFVAKQEIASWPIFGPLARLGGTIFLDRESRVSAWEAADKMAERLDQKVSVIFFPEGTSTDGSEVIRFHSTLFEPAVEAALQVTPAAIFYQPRGTGPAGGMTERDVCWFGDTSFLPHLIEVLGVDDFTAIVRFGRAERHPDRQSAAWRSHDAVAAMRSSH
jgi:1-acyl-sn-glycerol-3-phosphate acyltransferase